MRRSPDVVPYRQIQREFTWPLRLRIRMRLLDLRHWFHRVWMARSTSPAEWRARYRGIKMLEQIRRRDPSERITRRIMFGDD